MKIPGLFQVKLKKITLLKSPHVNKKSREHVNQISTSKRILCAHFCLKVCQTPNTFTLQKDESPTLASYLSLDEEVHYGSDTSVQGEEGTFFNPPLP